MNWLKGMAITLMSITSDVKLFNDKFDLPG